MGLSIPGHPGASAGSGAAAEAEAAALAAFSDPLEQEGMPSSVLRLRGLPFHAVGDLSQEAKRPAPLPPDHPHQSLELDDAAPRPRVVIRTT